MKLIGVLLSAITAPTVGGSVKALVRLLVILLIAVVAFSIGFHVIMGVEGREFSWITSLYWTLVTMTTLGFGDIVFESDLGRLYSVVVLLVGAVLILILLPFTFIQLVYLPFRAAVQHAKAPRRLPEETRGHILLTGRDPVEELLMRRAEAAGIPYALIVADTDQAVALHDAGYRVLVGDLDDPHTYRAARVDRAALVVTARSDQTNTNVAFTVREVTAAGMVVATATSADAVDVLELAGCDRVIQLGELLGEAFAARILSPTARSTVLSVFDDLVVAEASAAGTSLVGRSLAELDLRGRFGVSVVGLWDRGHLELATPTSRVTATSILLIVGRPEQIGAYDVALTSADAPGGGSDASEPHELVVILGGGRVGRALAASLTDAGIDHRIVDRLPERISHLDTHVVGDAADRAVLTDAGIDRATAVAVTTHDDDTNVYLTLYCRRLRPDIEILSRVRTDRNLTTMHRAGADVVLSYASTGAMVAWNALRGGSTLVLAEGLVVFRAPVPSKLVGRTLAEASIPSETGCTVIGMVQAGGSRTDVDGDTLLSAEVELVLIGGADAEERFLSRYGSRRRRRRWQRHPSVTDDRTAAGRG